MEDLDIELDIIEDGPMTDGRNLEGEDHTLEDRIEKEKRQKYFSSVCTTVALLLYAF